MLKRHLHYDTLIRVNSRHKMKTAGIPRQGKKGKRERRINHQFNKTGHNYTVSKRNNT